ncbi:MAG: PilT/PilU family type 4a pilus ATPase [Acidobacteria bacterium]|nr:PilT/PilU family type 4a pilus ATPase [Acidobacteriota bacterium]
MPLPIFQSDLKDVLKRLSAKDYQTIEERDELLQRLAALDGIKPRDIVWMLFRPDRALRDAAVAVLARLKAPETVDVIVAESSGKPEAAFKAAVSVLFQLGIPGAEARLIQLMSSEDEQKAATATKILFEAPVTPQIEQLLWQIATSGRAEQKAPAVARLASTMVSDKSLPRWQKLAADADRTIRNKALEVLARDVPAESVDVLVNQLPTAEYTTQQVLVEALTRASQGKGPEFADRIIPLIASGDPATRSAVLKILLGMSHRKELIRRYIMFAKTLAGWARDRALDSMKAFEGDLLEPAIELLSDEDSEIRSAALALAGSFDDPRIVPAAIGLLSDEDWWIRISAVETLGRQRDPRAVEPILAIINDPDVRWSAVEALGSIADNRALPALGKLLGDPSPDVRIEVLQALRHFNHPKLLDAIRNSARNDENRSVRMRAVDIAEEIAARDAKPMADASELRAAALTASIGASEPKLHQMLVATRNQGGSDFHLSVEQPPMVRIASELLRAQGAPFTAPQTEAMLKEILREDQWQRLEATKQLDFCYWIPQAGRYRANVFLDQKGYNAVFRVIPEKPPTIAEIGLPPRLAEIAGYHQGLVLICGPTGSGKSTTLAALVNLFNETRNDHVLTLEDPVEFVHPFRNCLVNQREVGTHTTSFARALRAALREDPDVIVIGEMRDNETIELALTAAETGHIVLGTINSTSAPKAIDRIISSFPVDEQAQIRTSLSESLKYVTAQRLLPSKQKHRQVACFEILKADGSIANLIRDEKTYQIYSAMQIGRSRGMQTFDDGLKDLLKRGEIMPETAYLAAEKKEDFEPLVSADFLESLTMV